jgi:hypothetical protein
MATATSPITPINYSMEKLGKTIFINSNLIYCDYIKEYYGNGISAALVDLFLPDEIAAILKKSFNKVFLTRSYKIEKDLRDYLFELVVDEANKIRSSEAEGLLVVLEGCYDEFRKYSKKLRRSIALTDKQEGYTPTLEKLDKYILQLTGAKDILRAKIVAGIYTACERRFLELVKDNVNPKVLKFPKL